MYDRELDEGVRFDFVQLLTGWAKALESKPIHRSKDFYIYVCVRLECGDGDIREKERKKKMCMKRDLGKMKE